jgi:hypothetical protein
MNDRYRARGPPGSSVANVVTRQEHRVRNCDEGETVTAFAEPMSVPSIDAVGDRRGALR